MRKNWVYEDYICGGQKCEEKQETLLGKRAHSNVDVRKNERHLVEQMSLWFIVEKSGMF